MKKRRYRATDVNQMNWAEIAEQAGEQPVVFAVDVAKEKFVGALMKPDRSVLKTIKWRHPEQTRELVHGLLSHLGAQQLRWRWSRAAPMAMPCAGCSLPGV